MQFIKIACTCRLPENVPAKGTTRAVKSGHLDAAKISWILVLLCCAGDVIWRWGRPIAHLVGRTLYVSWAAAVGSLSPPNLCYMSSPFSPFSVLSIKAYKSPLIGWWSRGIEVLPLHPQGSPANHDVTPP